MADIIEHFGTDGVRDAYGEGMVTEAGAYAIGRSAGARLEAGDDPRVIVGHDPRYSSEPLADALAEGLADAGREAVMVGTMPTPAIAYLSAQEGVPAADITASHNPAEDNGFKLFVAGEKISDAAQAAINLDLNGPVESIPRGTQRGAIVDGRRYGRRYEDFVVDSVPGPVFEGKRIAVDTANGATAGFAGRVLTRLGAEVTSLFDNPDGYNINRDCGAMHTEAIQRAVVEGKLDMGVAFDGDGDRLFVVGPDGVVYDGDDITFALGTEWREKAVVGTLMTNEGLNLALGGVGITLHRTKIGDRYVNQKLVEANLTIGAEPSGHVILRNHSTTGDGILAVAQIGNTMQQSGATMADWSSRWDRFPQTNIEVPVSKALAAHPDTLAKVRGIEDQLGTDGRVLLRPSGTQKLVRVMVEARGDPRVAEQHARTLADHLGQLAAA